MSGLLIELVKRYTERDGRESPFVTGIPGLTLLRSEQRKPPTLRIFKPALCIVLQGTKSSLFGGRQYDYGPGQALVVNVEMPAMSQISQASPAEPYLGLVIELDLAVMQSVLEKLPQSTPQERPARAVFLTHFDGALSDCVLRMVRLLETPEAVDVLAPLIMRELSYWLLAGPQGSEIAQLALAGDHTKRVIDAIHVLREGYTQTMRIETLAAVAKLSVSAFHRQFKALTAMTPLQYQKQLRLVAAQNLLLAGSANAETVALAVGYESPSQFSREYSRMYGFPPRQSIERLKASSRDSAQV